MKNAESVPVVEAIGWQAVCCAPTVIKPLDSTPMTRHCSLPHEYVERVVYAVAAISHPPEGASQKGRNE